MMDNAWNFQSKFDNSRYEGVPLYLEWDVVDAWYFSDNNLPEGISAGELFRRWAGGHRDQMALPLNWIVTSEASAVAERAPFLGHEEDFLTHYTHPWADQDTPLRFTQLPIKDQTWRARESRGKAGFIQEFTGWKPSPLQSVMDLRVILLACGISLA